MGRLGSDRPERLRRMALATAETAASWPTTRSWRTSSMRISFWTSPSIRFDTGMPVQRLTTSATSSASTSSFSIFCVDWRTARAALASSTCCCSSGISPKRTAAAFSRLPSRS